MPMQVWHASMSVRFLKLCPASDVMACVLRACESQQCRTCMHAVSPQLRSDT